MEPVERERKEGRESKSKSNRLKEGIEEVR